METLLLDFRNIEINYFPNNIILLEIIALIFPVYHMHIFHSMDSVSPIKVIYNYGTHTMFYMASMFMYQLKYLINQNRRYLLSEGLLGTHDSDNLSVNLEFLMLR